MPPTPKTEMAPAGRYRVIQGAVRVGPKGKHRTVAADDEDPTVDLSADDATRLVREGHVESLEAAPLKKKKDGEG